ncbi:Uncharacterised protein [uncultured archaeon]|nr:Uncharacterised protein [uncultured archaeon]
MSWRFLRSVAVFSSMPAISPPDSTPSLMSSTVLARYLDLNRSDIFISASSSLSPPNTSLDASSIS